MPKLQVPKSVLVFLFGLVVIGVAWGFMQGARQWTSKKPPATAGAARAKAEVSKTKEGQAPPVAVAPERIPIKAFRTAKKDFQDTLSVLGTVRGYTEIEMKFETQGVISSFSFREGDEVKQGETIAQLDPKDAQLKIDFNREKLNVAEKELAIADKKLEVHQGLFDVGAIIQARLDEVRLEKEKAAASVEQTRVELASAQQDMEKIYLRAPQDAVVGKREVDAGEFVTSNDKAVTLLDVSSVYVDVGIIERDIAKVKLGQTATVKVDAYPQVTMNGRMDNIFPLIEGKSRTLTARIKVENPGGKLLPGMFARCAVTIYEKKGAIVVPGECLFDTDQDGASDSVYAIGEEEVAALTKVKIGYIPADLSVVQIDRGLKEGQLVVMGVDERLKDGMKVEVTEIQEALP